MPEIQIRQGNTIYQKGNPLSMLSIIIEGTVSVTLPGDTLELETGDVVGLIDLYTNTHSYSYVAATDVVVESFPYKSSQSLSAILESDPTFPQLFAASASKQFFAVTEMCHLLTFTCDSLYTALMEYHRDYSKLCKQYQVPAKSLPGLETIQPLVLEHHADDSVMAYYKDLQKISTDYQQQAIFSYLGFLSGFLLRASQDMHIFLSSCDEMEEYLSNLSRLLINEDKMDFLDLFMLLLTCATQKNEDTLPLVSLISKIFIRTKNVSSISPTLHQQRLTEYRNLTQKLEEMTKKQNEDTSEQQKAIAKHLQYSLTTLLEFGGMSEEFCQKYIAHIDAYKKTEDKTSVSSELSALRSELTSGFFQLYESVFFASLGKQQLPEVVKMFLYFGYVDEDICGIDNATQLYSMLPVCRSAPEHSVYLFCDWLKLIYHGIKQPRRDEFDQDYPAYLQSMVNDGKINKATASTLLNDNKQKVIFEINNMFTSAVKMTYGRLQTYCPVLSEHDFIKSPTESCLQPQQLKDAFLAVTTIDFSAYCREVMFSHSSLANGRELIQREILPDIILLPNIGIRAALWQEIEGRNRSTPACMLFPIFCLTDLNMLVMRLTGEFRWEMCKRMQGSRWNDISNLSLTSEYFDYLQFYKKNKELSPEAKEKCRQQLQRTKNRFRESFILDYVAWLTYEAKGTPHMNKITRKIFMTYCPFSASYREALKKNPFYGATIEKYENNKSKEVTRMNNVIYRIQRNGLKKVPAELQQQLEFLTK